MRNFKDSNWKKNVTQVVQSIKEQDIGFVRLPFTGINSITKNLAVASKNPENILTSYACE